MQLCFNSLFSFPAWRFLSKAHLSRTASVLTRKNVFSVEIKFKASAFCFNALRRSLLLAFAQYLTTEEFVLFTFPNHYSNHYSNILKIECACFSAVKQVAGFFLVDTMECLP